MLADNQARRLRRDLHNTRHCAERVKATISLTVGGGCRSGGNALNILDRSRSDDGVYNDGLLLLCWDHRRRLLLLLVRVPDWLVVATIMVDAACP